MVTWRLVTGAEPTSACPSHDTLGRRMRTGRGSAPRHTHTQPVVDAAHHSVCPLCGIGECPMSAAARQAHGSDEAPVRQLWPHPTGCSTRLVSGWATPSRQDPPHHALDEEAITAFALQARRARTVVDCVGTPGCRRSVLVPACAVKNLPYFRAYMTYRLIRELAAKHQREALVHIPPGRPADWPDD